MNRTDRLDVPLTQKPLLAFTLDAFGRYPERDCSYHSEDVFANMDVPENLDVFLHELLTEESGAIQLDAEDRAFVDRILTSITQGSKGVFVVLHPNDRMQYMLLNTNRAGAIALLARIMQRTAEALEADLD
jgi:hypothetical protein